MSVHDSDYDTTDTRVYTMGMASTSQYDLFPSDAKHRAGGVSLKDPLVKESFVRRYSCALCTVGIVVFTLIGVLVAIFVGGRYYAQAVISDANISVDVTLGVVGDEIQASIVGQIDNRAVMGGTMDAATFDVSYLGTTIGTVEFPQVFLAAGGFTDLAINSTLTVADETAFTQFADAALNDARVPMVLSGSLKVHSFGIAFDSISMTKTVWLKGLSGFTTPPPTVLNLDIGNGEAQTMELEVECNIPNYSSMALNGAGRLKMDVLVDGILIGVAESRYNVSFGFGPSNPHTFDVLVTRTPANSAAIDVVVSNYTSGLESRITMKGRPDSTSVKLLAPALANMVISAPVPGLIHLEDKLLIGGYGFMNVTQFTSRKSAAICPETVYQTYQTVSLFGNNRFKSLVTVTAANLKVGWRGSDFAEAQLTNLDIKIPKDQITEFSQNVCLTNVFTALEIVNYAASTLGVKGEGKVPFMTLLDIHGTLTGSFGDFANVTMTYTQSGIPTTMFILQAAG